MHQLEAREQLASTEPESVKIGYIGGGSRGWAYTLINDLLQCRDISGSVALYDVDYEPAAQNAQLGNQLATRADAPSDWTFDAYRDIESVLEDADFVICSIQDPPGETFTHDIDVPRSTGSTSRSLIPAGQVEPSGRSGRSRSIARSQRRSENSVPTPG